MKKEFDERDELFIETYLQNFDQIEALLVSGYNGPEDMINASANLKRYYFEKEIRKRLFIQGYDEEEINLILHPQSNEEKDDGKIFIYLIREEWQHLIKIGLSNNPVSRLSNIQSLCPQELNLIFKYPREDAAKVEKKLHRDYSDKQYRGEWFELSDEDIEEIKNRLRNS